MADVVPPATNPIQLLHHSDSAADHIESQVAMGEIMLSPLGRRLLEARRRIEASGIPLLDGAELEREKAERRGGFESL